MASRSEVSINSPEQLFSERERLGSIFDAQLARLLRPFIKEKIPGKVYLPHNRTISCFPTSILSSERQSKEWRLVFNDENHEEVALVAFSPLSGRASLVYYFDQVEFLATLGQVNYQEPVIVFDRPASSVEINILQNLCQQRLKGKEPTNLFSTEDFMFSQAEQPVSHNLTIYRMAEGSHILNLLTWTTPEGRLASTMAFLNPGMTMALEADGKQESPSQFRTTILSRILNSAEVVG